MNARFARVDRTEFSTTAILRTQKSAFLFKDKESFLNKHRTQKKCFPFSRTLTNLTFLLLL
ncbi:hypothetical protein [Virgibacillus proomii]|uniref:hypothetical protein n=1 Tax=Virgibacillus proomii TaxID=84407 RepID=UPI001C0F9586|nr:hypothetical protein [Virgibacillus proomii]MBU5267147.1 hypothetical protein [Virgibacillus proomii]